MKYGYCYETPIGVLCFVEDDGYLTACGFQVGNGIIQEETALIKQAYLEVMDYFSDNLKVFTVPLRVEGTAFQKAVFKTLLEVSYGDVVSYADLAKRLNQPKAVRAVGGALNKNPLLVFIPCHRVIGKDGSLGGFAGDIEIKKWLLRHENESHDF